MRHVCPAPSLPASDPAQRDSAFARSLAYVESPSVRAAEWARLDREGLGLTHGDRRAVARATFPHGAARAYAHLLAFVTRLAMGSLRTWGGRRLGVGGREFAGLVGTGGALQTGRGGRVAALLVEDAPDAASPHLAQTGLDTSLVLDLLLDGVRAHPTGVAGRS